MRALLQRSLAGVRLAQRQCFPRALPTLPARTFVSSARPPVGLRFYCSDGAVYASPLPSDYVSQLPLCSVVKVFTDSSAPNYFLPPSQLCCLWQMKASRKVTGSGFVISGRRILTNAHVVTDHKLVTLRKFGSPDLFPAKVLAVGHDCDLALLTVEEDAFWDGMDALEFGDIPDLQAEVDVIGYPTGGDNISITHGVVSRIELQNYTHTGTNNLIAVQIDAAINPGNSGGPAVQGDKVAGVAFQNLRSAQNIGFIIPLPVIKHFLEDVDRHYPEYTRHNPMAVDRDCIAGFGFLGIWTQSLDNPSIRRHLKMQPHHTGIVVSFVKPAGDCVLKEDDVILRINGMPVANDGTIEFRNRERIRFTHAVDQRQIGESCELEILRDGKEMTVDVPVGSGGHLVEASFSETPQYCIVGGLVFTRLTQSYIMEWGEDWYNHAPRMLVELLLTGYAKEKGHEAVILSHVLADEANLGFGQMMNLVLLRFNGVDVLNLRHLVEMISETEEEYVVFEFEEKLKVVIETSVVRERGSEILDKFNLSHSLSPELAAVSSNRSRLLPQLL